MLRLDRESSEEEQVLGKEEEQVMINLNQIEIKLRNQQSLFEDIDIELKEAIEIKEYQTLKMLVNDYVLFSDVNLTKKKYSWPKEGLIFSLKTIRENHLSDYMLRINKVLKKILEAKKLLQRGLKINSKELHFLLNDIYFDLLNDDLSHKNLKRKIFKRKSSVIRKKARRREHFEGDFSFSFKYFVIDDSYYEELLNISNKTLPKLSRKLISTMRFYLGKKGEMRYKMMEGFNFGSELYEQCMNFYNFYRHGEIEKRLQGLKIGNTLKFFERYPFSLSSKERFTKLCKKYDGQYRKYASVLLNKIIDEWERIYHVHAKSIINEIENKMQTEILRNILNLELFNFQNDMDCKIKNPFREFVEKNLAQIDKFNNLMLSALKKQLLELEETVKKEREEEESRKILEEREITLGITNERFKFLEDLKISDSCKEAQSEMIFYKMEELAKIRKKISERNAEKFKKEVVSDIQLEGNMHKRLTSLLDRASTMIENKSKVYYFDKVINLLYSFSKLLEELFPDKEILQMTNIKGSHFHFKVVDALNKGNYTYESPVWGTRNCKDPVCGNHRGGKTGKRETGNMRGPSMNSARRILGCLRNILSPYVEQTKSVVHVFDFSSKKSSSERSRQGGGRKRKQKHSFPKFQGF